MPRENKTKFAVLGLLAYAPLSGYDIRRIYERSLGNFWSESYGHIYPILKRLVDEGLATRSVQHQSGKPDRHVYTITDEGRDELHIWLELPPEPHKERIELLLKLFHGWEVGPAAMIEHVRGVRAQHEALLSVYDGYDEHLRREAEAPAPYWLMTVNLGRHSSRAYIAWCDETIATLESLPPEPRAGAESWLSGPHETMEGHHER
jgi:PadR family transcriptional regulator, regulatory protein AphA